MAKRDAGRDPATGDLFEPPDPGRTEALAVPVPLAERMRPRRLEDVLGQKILRRGALLDELIAQKTLPSILLWGPPGSGKTTLARLLADAAGLAFVPVSAVLSGVKDLRQAIDDARRRASGPRARGTLLFVDEIHHFNKSQQDALLPHLEDGTVTFVGATTENPSFYVNAPLLSRCTVFVLDALDDDAMRAIALRALGDPEAGLGASGITLEPAALDLLVSGSHGDARSLLNRLEGLVTAAAKKGRGRAVGTEEAAALLQSKRLAFDKAGDQHFDLISALHKSVRASDPQAALYYLARILEGGEDPLYVCRRMVRCASEDVGLADPQALRVALDATEAFRFLGSPEGELAVAAALVYLATAPKSDAVYRALGAVRADVQAGAVHPVPLFLRNAPTKLMAELGYGAGYVNAHELEHGVSARDFLPPPLAGTVWYRPRPAGFEREIEKRLAWWEGVRRKAPEAGAGGYTQDPSQPPAPGSGSRHP
jgi:putative ATPase